jgi:hypothetical protein
MGLEQAHQAMRHVLVEHDAVWPNGRRHAQAATRVVCAHDHGTATTPTVSLGLSLCLVRAKDHHERSIVLRLHLTPSVTLARRPRIT